MLKMAEERHNELIRQLVREFGDVPYPNLTFEMVAAVLKMAQEDGDLLDHKIATNALKEMRHAFRTFHAHRGTRKVSMWGSARVGEDDPRYVLARDFARTMADRGWMVITGAGPGIMAAGNEGAGRERSFGLGIDLPFENKPNVHIEDDPKFIHFKYFFIRKLFFVREASAVALFPGGFGTMDEAFEVLTLLQTGRSPILPLVLVEPPASTYWKGFQRFLEDELVPQGLISRVDLRLFRRCTSAQEAADEIFGFYENYHSMRYVGRNLVLRYTTPLPEDEVAALPSRFPKVFVEGKPVQSGPLPEEADEPHLAALTRLAFPYTGGVAPIRVLLDHVNELAKRSRSRPSGASASPKG
ncbi:MAG TPA: LOG family protein [Candidatus Thermoplasmatota archaeon]|nr:LOG family protein [Candidatus Thermoplasmatota archaeon]